MHGTFGEDGTIQGLLDLAGLPSSALSPRSAIGMEKDVAKRLLKSRKFPLCPGSPSHRHDWESNPDGNSSAVELKFSYPVFCETCSRSALRSA